MNPLSTGHVDWMPGSTGPNSGFFEGLSAGYSQQYNVDSSYGMEAEVFDRWKDSLYKLERTTGTKFDMQLDYGSINNYVRAVKGEDPSLWQQSITLQGLDPTEAIKARAPFEKANAAIKQLNDPDIRSMEDIVDEVIKFRAGIEEESAVISETGGFMAGLGQFVGAVAGSFSPRDPLLLATMGFGGFGKNVAVKIGTEAGIAGGVETTQQFASVQPTRAVLGEEPGSPLTNVVYAMLGAGLLRGGFEGAAHLLGKVRGRGISEDGTVNVPELHQALEENIQSPSARAGLHLLDAQETFDRANPYGESPVGTRRFIAELDDVYKVMSGQTDTAIARALPELPYEVQLLSEDVTIVKAERPEVYDRLESAQAKLNEIDDRIAGMQQDIGDLSISDAISRVDQDAGILARSFEEDLKNPQLTSKAKADVERKLNTVIESIGVDRIVREAENVAIKPKKELQSMRASRRAASKEYRKARNEFDKALAQTQAEIKIKQMVGKPVKNVERLEPNSFNPEQFSPDVVAEVKRTISNAEETIPDASIRIVSDAMLAEDKIDLGNGKMVDKDFQFEVTNSDGSVAVLSAEAIMKDLQEDEFMLEVIRNCPL